jgi:hypothetical protein
MEEKMDLTNIDLSKLDYGKLFLTFVFKYWYFVFCYVITILGTHIIKNTFALFTGKWKDSLILLLSLSLALVSNLSVYLVIGFSWFWIMIGLMCWALSGFITIVFDKTGAWEFIENLTKNLLDIVIKKFIKTN